MRREYIRMVVVLMIISLFSGAVLAQTYKVTIPKINENALKKQEAAIIKVIPGAKSFKEVSKDGVTAFEGLDENGNKVGMAFIAKSGGFGGIITMMVGVDMEEKKLTGMTVLSHLETPGLGARIQEDWFQEQFKGKSFDDGFVVKEDVDAITGATISSTAVAKGVKDSLEKFLQVFGGEY